MKTGETGEPEGKRTAVLGVVAVVVVAALVPWVGTGVVGA